MKEVNNNNDTVTPAVKGVTVICQQAKDHYLKSPHLTQRLPREQRAYWYWFLKNHQQEDHQALKSSRSVH